MQTFYTKISLFLLILSSFLPTQADFTLLSLWDWQQDGKNIELVLMGDAHVDSRHSQTDISVDASHHALLKSVFTTWNSLGNVAFLQESNQWVEDFNKKELADRSPGEYLGMYYMLAHSIAQQKQRLRAITYDTCDIRGRAFYLTKNAIERVQEIFVKIKKMLLQNPRNWIDRNALQQNMKECLRVLPNDKKVTAQELLKELHEKAEHIRKTVRETKLDTITRDTLQDYLHGLDAELPKLEEFCLKNLSQDLGKTMLEALITHIMQEEELESRDQTKRATAIACLNGSLRTIRGFNEWFEKITNYIADAGFILALHKHKETSNKIALFAGHKHVVALNAYLAKYQSNKQAQEHFQINTNADTTTNPLFKPDEDGGRFVVNIPPDTARNFLAAAFNGLCDKAALAQISHDLSEANFDPQRSSACFAELTRLMQPFICSELSCPKISITQKFDHCSKCKTAHYCSPKCQRQDWGNRHKATCKPSLPRQMNAEAPRQVIVEAPQQINMEAPQIEEARANWALPVGAGLFAVTAGYLVAKFWNKE